MKRTTTEILSNLQGVTRQRGGGLDNVEYGNMLDREYYLYLANIIVQNKLKYQDKPIDITISEVSPNLEVNFYLIYLYNCL